MTVHTEWWNCQDKRAIAEIRPVETLQKSELEEYEDILQAWDFLHEKKGFNSSQYYYLALYARQKKLKLEMGIQFSEGGSVVEVDDESYLTACPDNSDVMMIDPEALWALLRLPKCHERGGR